MSAKKNRVNYALIVTFTILTCVTTTLIRIPIPATTGYFNIGDVFIISAALVFGPMGGLITGAIGAGAADLIGYPQFFLATAVTKGLEGYLVGVISKTENLSDRRAWIAASIGGITIILGYFLFEAFIYPAISVYVPFFEVTNFQDAVVEVIPNCIQAVIGVVGGVGLWRSLSVIRRN
jgi:uncharacterized membrane protein